MSKLNARLAGVELYFDDLPAAKRFYQEILGLNLTGEEAGRYAQFDGGTAFVCVEKKGLEDYPSRDKAVLFLEVGDLTDAIKAIGPERIVRQQAAGEGQVPWAVLHDPEGHSILLLEARRGKSGY
jgi:predicted enzyme related to lactoylglutathione lyase